MEVKQTMLPYNSQMAFFLPSLDGGGAERVLVTLANGFVERGKTVDIVLVKSNGPLLAELDGRVNIVDLDKKNVLGSLLPLIRYLRKYKPRVLLSTLGHANVVASLAHLVAGVPTRLVLREANTPGVQLSQLGFKGKIIIHLCKVMYRRADSLIGVSTGVTEDIRKTLKVPSRVPCCTVFNPVVTNDLLKKSSLPIYPPFPWKDNWPIILGVGRLTKQKDFSTLIKAFAILRAKCNVHLCILGEGRLRKQLEYEVEALGVREDVWLPGFVDNPFAYMKSASVYVLSSRWEGLPNALIQAMACGAAIVSTDCPSGPSEILESGKWGELVSVGNVEEMVNAISIALQNRNSRDVVNRANDFHVDKILDEYERILIPNV